MHQTSMGHAPAMEQTAMHQTSRDQAPAMEQTTMHPTSKDQTADVRHQTTGNQRYRHTKYVLYTEYHSVFPFVGIGTLPPPFSPASVPLPPYQRGGGEYSPAGEGSGESQFRRLEKKLSTLPTLCTDIMLAGRYKRTATTPYLQTSKRSLGSCSLTRNEHCVAT
jgi:hypothetical protein